MFVQFPTHGELLVLCQHRQAVMGDRLLITSKQSTANCMISYD